MNLSLPTALPVAHNYNNFFLSADYKGSTESTTEIPKKPTFIAQNRKTPCQLVTAYNLINFINEFWSPPVTLGYNQLPLPHMCCRLALMYYPG